MESMQNMMDISFEPFRPNVCPNWIDGSTRESWLLKQKIEIYRNYFTL